MTVPQLHPQPSVPGRPAALVTGATSGIGLELARVLAAHGHDLVLVARRIDALGHVAAELERAHGMRAIPFPADLADPLAPQRIAGALRERGIALDVLVNNAGFGLAGPFAQADLRRALEMIPVNVTALTALTGLVLPGMIARRRGRIMNVASIAAFQPGPLMAVYYASKAYVLSFSEAVAEEVRDTGVTITALCPGPTRTAFAQVAEMRGSRLFSSAFVMPARDVAEFGYRAMMRGKRVAIPGLLNRLVAFSTRLAPRRLATRLSRLAQENR